MQIKLRHAITSIAIVASLAAVRVFATPAHPDDAGASITSLIVSMVVLATAVMTGYLHFIKVYWSRPSLTGAAMWSAIAIVPAALLISAVFTGQIRHLGRGSHPIFYSVHSSPIGYWSTFLVYAFVCAVLISWVLAHVHLSRRFPPRG